MPERARSKYRKALRSEPVAWEPEKGKSKQLFTEQMRAVGLMPIININGPAARQCSTTQCF